MEKSSRDIKINKIRTTQTILKDIIIRDIIHNPRRRIDIFKGVPINNRGFVLLSLSIGVQKKILKDLTAEEISELLHYLDPDKTTDIVQRLPEKRRQKVIDKLKVNLKHKVEFLLHFNPKTAAGMMSLDYIEANEKSNFKEIHDLIKKHEKRTGKIPTILVVEKGLLLGYIPIDRIALHHGSMREKIEPHIKKIPTIRYDADNNEIIRKFTHPHDKIVVLDDDNSILGIIYSDDIINLIKERSGKTIYQFAGVKNEEMVYDSILTKVKNRYMWIILNLGTMFLASAVVSIFQETIAAFVLLAVYMPIIAGMGSNAGVQTMAVVIRGITLKEIDIKSARHVIFNEIISGGINGLIIGLIVTIIAILWNKSGLLGLVVGVSLVINLMIAGLFGATIPLIMKKLDKDPATSVVFITTATDILGLFVFLELASLVL